MDGYRGWLRGRAVGIGFTVLVALASACGESDTQSGGTDATGAAAGSGNGGASSATGGSSTSGAAGVGGGASGGAAGAGGGSAGMRCAPGETNEAPYPGVVDNCYYWEREHEGIPNILRTSLRRINLPTPTVPGQNYALSLGMQSGGTNSTIELWAADGECGNVGELLWWGPMRPGEICAEFRPTTATSHLIMAWRAQTGDVGAYHASITFCPTGTCGAARDGKGLGLDGDALDAPMGAFQVSAGLLEGRPLNFNAKVGYGRMHVTGSAIVPLGGTVPVEAGYFRMQDTQPFDDAWYCTGPGSTFTWSEAEFVHFDYQSVTRLASCPLVTGTGTVTITTDPTDATVIESSLTDIATSDASFGTDGCFPTSTAAPCHLVYRFADGRPDLMLHAYQMEPMRTEGEDTLHDFSDTALIVMPGGSASPKLACAGAGSVRFRADGSMTIELTEVSEYQTCPGEPTTSSVFTGDLEFL